MHEKFELLKKTGGDISPHMRRYLADVLSLDESIGRLLAKIDELGLREKTIVVFSSDQGAAPIQLPAEAAGKKSAKAAKRTAAQSEARLDLLGYVGNFRGGKHNMYEGGVRVPFIIRWPGHVPAGRIDDKTLFSAIDWLPTLCRLTGAKPPNDQDGEDVLDLWLGKNRERTKALFWKTSNVRSEVAVLDGNWKLIWPGAKRGETELYDLSSDPGETHNVAAQNPNVLNRLLAKAKAWDATLPTEYIKSAAGDNDK
jgi:N-acetylgalactosamine-6-sulfatase